MTWWQAAASTKYITELRATYEYFLGVAAEDEQEAFKMLAMKKLHVDTRVARCSSTADEEMIRTCIVTNGGFKLLDTVIFNIRKRLAREIMHRAQEVALMLPLPMSAAGTPSAASSAGGRWVNSASPRSLRSR